VNEFKCFVCGFAIDPKSSGTYRRVRCWIENGSRRVKKVEELYDYAHGSCLDVKKPQNETLFG